MIEFNFSRNNFVQKCHELPPGTIFTPVNHAQCKEMVFQVSAPDNLPDGVVISDYDDEFVLCQRLYNGMLDCMHKDTDCIVYNITMELTPKGVK